VLIEIGDRKPLIGYSFTVEHSTASPGGEFPPPLGLTTREWEVACLLMSGMGTSETARELGISYATVRAHIRKILSTLDANSRTQAMMRLWSRYGIPENSPFRGLS
jgi:DNA-binding NarL/FixJ family response regulator